MVEIKVRPVTRYVVTRFSQGPEDDQGRCSGSVEECGEFQTAMAANNAASAFEARAQQAGKQVFITLSDERLAECSDMDLMAELIRRNKRRMQPSPRTRTFGSPHMDVCLGIGRDHSADLTLDEGALAELNRRTGVWLGSARPGHRGGSQ